MSDDPYSPPQTEAMAKIPLADTHVELSPDEINADSVYKNLILPPGTSKLHAIMVPYPLQGHINPMVQFAKALITHHNFIVTFVNNEHNHKRIQETRSKSTHKGADDINYCLRFVWVDNGLPPDFDYSDLSAHHRRREFHAGTLNMEGPLKELVKSLIDRKSPPVTCIVFGSFCSWAHSVAVELNIPNVFFWSQSASVFSIYYHAPTLASHGFFPYKMTAPGTDNMVSYIPGVPPLHPASVPTLLHIDDLNNLQFKAVKEQFETLQNCDAVIINSYHELEREACQALLSVPVPFPVSFVGPLLPSSFLDGSDGQDTSFGASLLQDNSDCIRWLDGQQKQSVLYISFGSVFCPPADDLHSIALGIKACEQPFLWVIRPRSSVQSVSDNLPDKFLEETKDYGMFIAWAPQLQVLSHPSVGAFLTHCGWNSTLESLSMGVPMIPFPIMSDQTTNCTFVVDMWKVGLSIQRQDDGKVGIGEVEAVVKTLFHREEGRAMRRKAGQLKEAARRAVQAEGSSSVHIKNFVQTIIRCGAN